MEQVLLVTVIRNDGAFDDLRPEWTRLLQESASDTVFLTWEWARSWWTSYGAGRELYVLRVEDEGRLIALAPFYRSTWRALGVLPYRRLHLIGDGSWDSDYLDLIVSSGDESRAVPAIVKFLLDHRRDWDILFLNEVPQSSGNLKTFRDLLRGRTSFWVETEVGCTHAALPTDWDDYLKTLKPRMRTKIRSLTSRLEQGHRVTFDSCERPEELPGRLESLFDLHRQRWHGKQQDGVFGTPSKRRFYLEVAGRFLPLGWLRFYSLAVDGRYVAHEYCLEYQNRLFLLQEGFDPAWEERGVGNVLRGYVFRDCIGRKLAAYDFLGGVTAHKLSWGGTQKTSVRITMALPTLKARLLFGAQAAREASVRRLKLVLPTAWTEVLRRARARVAAA